MTLKDFLETTYNISKLRVLSADHDLLGEFEDGCKKVNSLFMELTGNKNYEQMMLQLKPYLDSNILKTELFVEDGVNSETNRPTGNRWICCRIILDYEEIL